VALTDRPPSRLLRVALRAPNWIYRLGLGGLLGGRFLQIAHRGRVTGRLRRTVVEVVRFDGAAPEVVVTAGWGPATQWYRNLAAAPAEEVRLGRRRWPRPSQRFLDEAERIEVLSGYVRAHPRAARELGRFLGAPNLAEGEIRELAARIRAVAFRPSSAG
jgi:deazaflavin-dependent oxidoreductase (nitroreductase family)